MRKVEKYITSVFFVVVIMFLSMTALGNEDNDIEFPKEDGPYTIWISGTWFGDMHPSIIIAPVDGFYKIGPISWINYPNGFSGHIAQGPGIIIIDGEIQDFPEDTYIDIKGFKGYYPGVFQYISKLFYFGRVRMFGICEEIDLNP